MASRSGLGRLWQWLGIVLVAVGIWQLIPTAFWPYLFFLRVPCVAALLLLLFPWIALGPLRALLDNLLVLRGPWQLFFVILGTFAAGMSTSSVATVILGNASVRFLSSATTELAGIHRPPEWHPEEWAPIASGLKSLLSRSPLPPSLGAGRRTLIQAAGNTVVFL